MEKYLNISIEMQQPSLKLVRPNEQQPSREQQALEEIGILRQGLDRVESLYAEILSEKRRRLDQLETLILSSGTTEISAA
jgi:hypothetical protein